MRLFGSRWVDLPGHVRELPGDAGLPEGFRASGVAWPPPENPSADT